MTEKKRARKPRKNDELPSQDIIVIKPKEVLKKPLPNGPIYRAINFFPIDKSHQPPP